jgi:hypothetical protein
VSDSLPGETNKMKKLAQKQRVGHLERTWSGGTVLLYLHGWGSVYAVVRGRGEHHRQIRVRAAGSYRNAPLKLRRW